MQSNSERNTFSEERNGNCSVDIMHAMQCNVMGKIRSVIDSICFCLLFSNKHDTLLMSIIINMILY